MKLSEQNTELFEHLRPGDIAVDCGANVGDVTAVLAETGATVYAFEPDPFAFRVLQRRFLHVPNVKCLNLGVWHENGKMPLYLHQEADRDPVYYSFASSIFSHKIDVDPELSVDVEFIDLPEFISKLQGKIGFLKLDIEGAEFEILDKIIEQKLYLEVGQIVVETHEDTIPAFRSKAEQLRKTIEERHITNIDLNWN